jgi:microcystin-dependent protein
MGSPYIGEIRIFAGTFNPQGWAFCDGALLPISEYDTLFNLIGTTYGGDGQETFGLPDLRGRVPVHMGTDSGTTYIIGEMAGLENVTLTTPTLASHSHTLPAASTNQVVSPSGAAMLAQATSTQAGVRVFSTAAPGTNFVPSTISASIGGGQPHENRQPLQGLNFIISLFGIYPSPT